jgi:hypothetical protein
MAMLPNPCNLMSLPPPSHLFTAGNIQDGSFQNDRDKGEGIWFTTPVVEGLRPIGLGSHILVAYEEGLVESVDCKPRSFQVRSILTFNGMQRINALPVPEPVIGEIRWKGTVVARLKSIVTAQFSELPKPWRRRQFGD